MSLPLTIVSSQVSMDRLQSPDSGVVWQAVTRHVRNRHLVSAYRHCPVRGPTPISCERRLASIVFSASGVL